MSYGIMPYKIRLAALNEVLAIRDEQLSAWVQSHCRDGLDDLEDGPRAAEVMADLMLGRPLDHHPAHLPGYCLRILCELWGVPLPNDEWCAMSFGWFDTVEAATAQAGVEYAFTGLIFGGPGVPVPESNDFPAMGYVAHEDLQADLDQLAGLDLAAIDDERIRSSVTQVRSWLQECLRDDMDLVCFYY